MWTVLSVCFIILTSIYGITEILRELWLYLVRPKGDPPRFTLIILKDDIFKEQLGFALEHLSWEKTKNLSGIIAVDSALSNENKSILKQIIKNKHNIMLFDEAVGLFKK